MLGAPPEKVSRQRQSEIRHGTSRRQLRSRIWLEAECKRLHRWPVIVAGSVVATEEPLALIAYGVAQGDFQNALLVLAPRKPERFAAAAAFIDESHRKFIRRSELAVPGPGFSGDSGAQ